MSDMKISLSLDLFLHKTPYILSTIHHFCSKNLNTQSKLLNTWNTSTSNLLITNPILKSIESCTTMSQLKQIHAQMMRKGLIFHTFPVSRIVAFSALSNQGDIDYAHVVFDQILCPNVYIWNTMIKGFCRVKNYVMGVCFFRRMIRDGVEMDARSFVFGLKAFQGVSGFREGEGVHCVVWKVGFAGNVLVGNGLVNFYAVGGFLSCARQVFDEICERDVVTWTALIGGFVQGGALDEGLRIFGRMLCGGEVTPNEVTMITMLSACALKADLNLGRRLHCYIEKSGVTCTLNLKNSLVDMYVKCSGMTFARRVFELMEFRDVFSWTSMVNGFAKCGELELARRYFDQMPAKNVVSWNAMIAGYSQNNRPDDALELFRDMVQGGVVPIEATLVCVLSACAQSSNLNSGQWIHHHYIGKNGIELSMSLRNALIDMYAKCGQIDVAEELFNDMPQKGLVSWNSMINSYADHGKANEALTLFDRAVEQGIKPDHITYVGILSACSHAGLVARGRKHFTDMKHVFGLEPKVEHFACMIDLLGRVGLLEEAYEMIRTMPVTPDVAVWGAFLNGCRMHGNADLGKLAAAKLIDLDPADSGTYVILANLCSREKRWDDVSVIRHLMREKGVRKTQGRSSIELEGQFHDFSVADDSHTRSEDIYRILEIMFSNLENDIFQTLDSHETADIISNG